MQELKKQLQKAISQVPNFDKLKNHIEMTVTPEGLRIELLEAANDTFFQSGSAKLNADGTDIMVTLAQQLGKLPNKLSVEGHTDAKPYAAGSNYSNWELSADRANSARRLIQQNGVGQDQVTEVRGFADQRLRKPNAPLDPSNRRISLIVHYLDTGQKPVLPAGTVAGTSGASSPSPAPEGAAPSDRGSAPKIPSPSP